MLLENEKYGAVSLFTLWDMKWILSRGELVKKNVVEWLLVLGLWGAYIGFPVTLRK